MLSLCDVGGLGPGRGLVTRGHTRAGGLGGPSCLRPQSGEPESPLSGPMKALLQSHSLPSRNISYQVRGTHNIGEQSSLGHTMDPVRDPRQLQSARHATWDSRGREVCGLNEDHPVGDRACARRAGSSKGLGHHNLVWQSLWAGRGQGNWMVDRGTAPQRPDRRWGPREVGLGRLAVGHPPIIP